MIDKAIKERAKLITPLVRFGKNGLTSSQVDEIKKVLKTKKLVKIKFLKSFPDRDNIKTLAYELAANTSSELVSVIGFVVVLYKR